MVNVFRRRQTFAALLIAGLLGLSISSLMPSRVQAGEADPALGTVTDLQGRTVKVHLPVRRVILGEGRQLYLVAALDTQNPIERIVGWRKDLIQSDPDTYNAYLRKFPDIAKIPTFGGFESGTFDIEQAISQKPDVIILNIEAQHATEDARYIEKLDALGIPVVYVDFRNNPMQNTEPTMRLFGKLFGKEERAEAFIDFRNQQIHRVTDVIEKYHPARPNVFIERIGGYTDDCCLSFGNENFGLFVDMAGGNNIARRIIPSTFGQLNPEQVIVANPDHVVVTSADWEAFAPRGHWVGVGPGADLTEARRKLAWYTQRPAYAGIKAQNTQAFHAIWHQFYNSPYQFVAIQQLAKWFHPELFADLDPDAEFREMHERFLPVPYEPGYFVSLQKTEDKP
ncbi:MULTISPECIES: ABC transporter substrate-binding protein [Pseudomonas]|uniref:ABC transporter substrate-binding protein n=1 Tax=Pseudomonas TaxID=286 RepID=UPI000875F13F|nr:MULTISPECIES: ABC transporter substrate-binding protein [Pseudomonas]POA36700.1 ABC transporter substrate-binding protein [Pseudomonas sp. GW456-12-1-14-TSB6]TFA85697.1 iron complex transport system substrate-binding protein [Pseudomonas sp. LAIL14HWK12:I2]SCZ41089.1 iron complex transport system substrate-binding protein [Pseudomonas sp. NFIX46]SDB51591.1 iron complex transport system substrate-binding protein [Pseudomonas putida]SFQ92789.1 iron complex transport system substrate-binding p